MKAPQTNPSLDPNDPAVIYMACPFCGSVDELRTNEVLSATADVTVVADKITGEMDAQWSGYTDVDWDSQDTVGLGCGNCDWSGEWSDLVPERLVSGPPSSTAPDSEVESEVLRNLRLIEDLERKMAVLRQEIKDLLS